MLFAPKSAPFRERVIRQSYFCLLEGSNQLTVILILFKHLARKLEICHYCRKAIMALHVFAGLDKTYLRCLFGELDMNPWEHPTSRPTSQLEDDALAVDGPPTHADIIPTELWTCSDVATDGKPLDPDPRSWETRSVMLSVKTKQRESVRQRLDKRMDGSCKAQINQTDTRLNSRRLSLSSHAPEELPAHRCNQGFL